MNQCKHGKRLYGATCLQCDREAKAAIARESVAAIPKVFWGNKLEQMTVEQLQAILDLAPDWAERWNSFGVWKGCYAARGIGVLDANGVWHNNMDILPPGYELSEIRAELARRANEPIKVGDYVVHKTNNFGVCLVIDDPKPCDKGNLIAKYREDSFIHIEYGTLQDDYRRATAEERRTRTIYLTDMRTGELMPTSGFDDLKGTNSREELQANLARSVGSEELANQIIANSLDLDPDFYIKNPELCSELDPLIIKACPFCGGPPCVEVKQDQFWAKQFPDDEPTYDAHVWCHECGARGASTSLDFTSHDYYDKEATARNAVEKWNDRGNTFSRETARLFNLERDL